MKQKLAYPDVHLLKNQIDFSRVPFSDRGSRLMVFIDYENHSLHIRLAERLTSLEPGIEAYLHRPPLIENLVFIDENGDKLEFDATTYPYALYFQTKLGEFGIAFEDQNVLGIGLPTAQVCGIQFHVSPQLWKTNPHGGEFKSIRNLAYATNSEISMNEILPENGGYKVTLAIQPSLDRTIIIDIANALQPEYQVPLFSDMSALAEKRWTEWFRRVPPVHEEYLLTYSYAWWVMANNLVGPLGYIYYEAMMPSMGKYIGLWLWDNAMHTLAFRHVDPELARNQIRVMIAHQLPDGMLPDAIYDEGVISEIDHPIRAKVTKPPILAWASVKLHETDPDVDFLQEIYTPLVRWNAWWFSMNDDDRDGLAQYNHPYSSGLDDNPLWDDGMPVKSPDLNTYLCIQMRSLAEIAEILGLDEDAAMWRRQSEAIVRRMIDILWNEEKGVFLALHDNQPIDVLTPFNLYPLWTGQIPENIRLRLIEHLTTPDKFWGEFKLPSVAYNDPHHDPETMWRGPVWVNINYFFIEALRNIGETDLAAELTWATLDLINSHSGIFEYYNACTGVPPDMAAEAFGWTAGVFIDLAIISSHPN